MNYYKLKDQAPNGAVYVKMGKDMVFLPVEDIPQVKSLLQLLDKKDDEIAILEKRIEELDKAFRTMETALRHKGVKL